MRRRCIFEYHQFSSWVFSLVPARVFFIYLFYSSCQFLSLRSSSHFPFMPHYTEVSFSVCLIVFSLSIPLCPSLVSPAEPEEKQKEILNNTIPEGKDSGDLPVFTLLSAWGCAVCLFCAVIVGVLYMWILEYKSAVHTGLSLVFSEVCGWLPRPVVRRDGASRQRGASQCGGVSVCLQGGPGLRRPGDSGLWHEGNASKNCRLLHYGEGGCSKCPSLRSGMNMCLRFTHLIITSLL